MPTKEFIGARIRAARGAKGWSQEELGRRFGVSHAAISDLERGVTQKIDINDLERLAHLLDQPLNYFLGRETEEQKIENHLRQVAREAEKLRREVEELTGEMARLVWIPIRGTVPGGYPDFREEVDLEEHFPVPKGLIRDPEKAFALRVTGNSMNGRGILDGDVVVADMTLELQPGDIVVVRRNEEAVLRIYERDDKGAYLDAANEGYKRLRLKEGRIVGVVVYSGREHRRQQAASS